MHHLESPARVVTAIAAALVGSALAAAQVPASKEWNQPHGNAASTAFVDVAALKATPVERWRLDQGTLLAAPVVAQEKLFVARKVGEKSELLVVDPATGTTIAQTTLDPIGPVFALAAHEGLAILVEPAAIHGVRLAGRELKREKSVAGTFVGEPLVSGPMLLIAREGGGLAAIDWAAGKALPIAPKCFARPSVLAEDTIAGKTGPSLVAVSTDDQQVRVTLNRFPITTMAAATKLGPAEALFSGTLVAKEEHAPNTVLVAVAAATGAAPPQWCGWFGGPRGTGMLRTAGLHLLEFLDAPAAKSGRLYGFDRAERLIEFDHRNDQTTVLMEKELRKKTAQPGAPSIARDVLYLGNWAVELGSKRVLWTLDAIEADGPAIPGGDELLVIRTKAGALVGFGNGPAGAKPAAGATSPSASAAAAIPAGPAVLPGSTPGLVRSDGIFVAGAVSTLPDGRFRVAPASGAAQELAADAVSVVDTGTEVKRVGEESALFRACWRVVGTRHAEAMVPVFEKWREAKLYDECRRLLDEMTRDGLSAERADELLSGVAGLTPAKLAATSPVRKKCQDFENAARAKSTADMVAAAKWCADKAAAKTAATVLVARAGERSPKSPPDSGLAAGWRPSSFPGGDGAQVAGRTWTVWAEALLPSGATFAELDASTQRRMASTKFGGADAITLRTRNILLFTRETDPAVLGPLLVRGEATVRALQKILGPSPTGIKGTAPLEVRLHPTRSDYLEDRIIGSLPPAWSAGCYSPTDGVSRFYSKMAGDEEDPLAHSLHEVFAHELTHHYLDRRWIRERSESGAGYWMVEGFAEFVAEQALEIGRIGETFDNATVRSVDSTAATAAVDMLLPLDTLLEIDRRLFHKVLEGGRFGPLQLKHTLKEIHLDKRGVFYAEAAALTFFVMNRTGEKGRAAYIAWLTKVYSGEPLVEPWKDLGFPDLNAFKKAFRCFLADI